MITRMQMPRQLRNMGGITNAVPRKKYGLGSKIKERFRKLIPNELANIAVRAAPFVAPFNPGIAGLMRGIGRFDQRGSISDALKQGAATFGFGKAAGFLGGAEGPGGIFGKQTFTKEGFRQGPLGRRLFKEAPTLTEGNKIKGPPGGGDPNMTYKTPSGTTETKGLKVVQKGVDFVKEKVPILENLPDDVAQKLLVGSVTSGASALYSYFTGEFEPQQPGETMGEYMARRNERVKQQMRSYMDSYYTPLRNPEYAAMSEEQKNNYIDSIVGQTEIEGTTDYQGENMATGGRVGYQTGGISMTNTAAQNRAINNAQRGMNKANMATARARNKQQNFVKNMFNVATGSGAHERATREYLNPFKGGKTYDTAYLQKNNPEVVDYMSSYLKNYINPKNQAGGKFGQSGVMSVTGLGRSPNIFTKQGMSEAAKSSSDPSFQAENLFGQGTLKKTPTGYDYTGGKFDFNFEPGTMMSGVEKYLLRPSEYKLSFDKDFNPITQTTTPTPDASTVSQEGLIPGFTKVGERSYQGPDGQIYGPETYASIAAGMYPDIYDPNKATLAAGGMPTGIMRSNKAGVMERDYRDEGGFVPVGIKEKADDVPAMLSKNEFVFTADAVRGAGNGSIEKGAQRMYDTMKNLEKRVV